MSDVKATKYVICSICGEGSWRRPSRCKPPIKCHACAARINGRLTPGNVVHGHSRTNSPKHPLYPVWKEMRGRCERRTHKYFKHYGARGITVCDEWSTFPPFLEWMENNGWEDIDGPRGDRLSIDRIDVNKGYYPDNCRVITHRENSRLGAEGRWRRYREGGGPSEPHLCTAADAS